MVLNYNWSFHSRFIFSLLGWVHNFNLVPVFIKFFIWKFIGFTVPAEGNIIASIFQIERDRRLGSNESTVSIYTECWTIFEAFNLALFSRNSIRWLTFFYGVESICNCKDVVLNTKFISPASIINEPTETNIGKQL